MRPVGQPEPVYEETIGIWNLTTSSYPVAFANRLQIKEIERRTTYAKYRENCFLEGFV